MADEIVQGWYGVDGDAMYADREQARSWLRRYAPIETIAADPTPLLDQFAADAVDDRDLPPEWVFEYRFFIRAGGLLVPLDPRESASGRDDWEILDGLLAPRHDARPRRFELTLDTDDERLCLVQRRFTGDYHQDGKPRTTYNVLSSPLVSIDRVAPHLRQEALSKLDGFLEEVRLDLPLDDFLAHAARAVRDTIVMNHILYWRVADRLREGWSESGREPSFVLTELLAPPRLVRMARPALLATIREKAPDFDFHATLDGVALTADECQPGSQAAWTRGGVRRRPLSLPGKNADLVPLAADRNLDRTVSVMHCELSFASYRVERAGDFQLDAATAVRVATHLEELSDTWEAPPKAREVAYGDFWTRPVWNETATGASARSTTAFRFALYDPPYWRLPLLERKIIDAPLVTNLFGPGWRHRVVAFAVDTAPSSFFLHEWWDFLWVAWSPITDRVVVVWGTSTD